MDNAIKSNGKLLVVAIVLLCAVVFFANNGFTGLFTAQASGEPIKIGSVLPLTGKGATFGEDFRAGMELALEKVNREGGINGRKLEAIYEDDKTDPSTAVSITQKLVNVDGVSVVFTGMSAVVNAVAPVAEKNKVVLIAATALTQPAIDNEYVLTDFSDISSDCKFFAEKLKGKKVAFIGSNTDTSLVCIKIFKENGFDMLSELFSNEAVDFRAQATKIKEYAPEVIVLRLYKTQINLLLKHFKELNVTGTLVCPQIKSLGCDSEQEMGFAKDLFENGFGSTFDYDETNSKTKAFVDLYTSRYGKKPSGESIYFYDDTLALANALRSCDKKGLVKDSNCIKQELQDNSFETIADGSKVSFDKFGVALRNVTLFKFQNGKWNKVISATQSSLLPVSIGAVIPLSGPSAGTGNTLLEGWSWKIDEYKNDGRKIDFFVEDTQSDAKQAVSGFSSLVEVKNAQIVFTGSSSASMALKPLAEQDKVLLWADATHPKLTQDASFILRHANTADSDAAKLVKSIKQNGFKRVGVLYQQDDWGVVSNQVITSLLKEEEIEAYSEAVDNKASDFRTQLIKIKENNPDALVFFVFGAPAGLLIKQSKELGFNSAIYSGVGLILTPSAIDVAKDYLKGTYYQTWMESPVFASDYQKKFGKSPAAFSMAAYTDIELLFYAIDQTHSTQPQKLIEFIKNLKSFEGKYEKVSINSQGDIIVETVIKQWN